MHIAIYMYNGFAHMSYPQIALRISDISWRTFLHDLRGSHRLPRVHTQQGHMDVYDIVDITVDISTISTVITGTYMSLSTC